MLVLSLETHGDYEVGQILLVGHLILQWFPDLFIPFPSCWYSLFQNTDRVLKLVPLSTNLQLLVTSFWLLPLHVLYFLCVNSDTSSMSLLLSWFLRLFSKYCFLRSRYVLEARMASVTDWSIMLYFSFFGSACVPTYSCTCPRQATSHARAREYIWLHLRHSSPVSCSSSRSCGCWMWGDLNR